VVLQLVILFRNFRIEVNLLRKMRMDDRGPDESICTESRPQTPTSARSTETSISTREFFYMPFLSSRSSKSNTSTHETFNIPFLSSRSSRSSSSLLGSVLPTLSSTCDENSVSQEKVSNGLTGAGQDVGRKVKKVKSSRKRKGSVGIGAALDSILGLCHAFEMRHPVISEEHKGIAMNHPQAKSEIFGSPNAIDDVSSATSTSENHVQSFVRETMQQAIASSLWTKEIKDAYDCNFDQSDTSLLVLRQQLAVLQASLSASEQACAWKAVENELLTDALDREFSIKRKLEAEFNAHLSKQSDQTATWAAMCSEIDCVQKDLYSALEGLGATFQGATANIEAKQDLPSNMIEEVSHASQPLRKWQAGSSLKIEKKLVMHRFRTALSHRFVSGRLPKRRGLNSVLRRPTCASNCALDAVLEPVAEKAAGFLTLLTDIKWSQDELREVRDALLSLFQSLEAEVRNSSIRFF
jgi:hypothetical protein